MKVSTLFYFVFLVLSFAFCHNNSSQYLYYTFQVDSLKANTFSNYRDKLNFINCFQFISNKNNLFLYNVTNDNLLLKFDLTKDTVTKFNLPIPTGSECKTFNVLNNNVIYLSDGKFYNFNLDNSKLDTFNSLENPDSYLITNFNHNCCNFINDTVFYLQVGNSSSYNFIDTALFTFYTLSGETYKRFNYPSEFHERYIHFLNYVTVSNKDTIYAINHLDNKIIKYSSKGVIDSNLIDGTRIPKYDTTKFTDLQYIAKYSNNNFTSRLFVISNYVILIRQLYSNKSWENYMYLFDKNLKKITKTKLQHPLVDPRLIFSGNNSLYFLNFDKKVMYKYEFK